MLLHRPSIFYTEGCAFDRVLVVAHTWRGKKRQSVSMRVGNAQSAIRRTRPTLPSRVDYAMGKGGPLAFLASPSYTAHCSLPASLTPSRFPLSHRPRSRGIQAVRATRRR